MNAQTLPLPNPGDWTTVDGACEILGVSRRTVARMVAAQVLTAYRVRGAGRREILLWVPEVREVAQARKRVRPERCA